MYLDEECLVSTNLGQDFTQISTLIYDAVKEGFKPRKKSTIYSALVAAELDIATLLFSPGSLDEDLRKSLIVQFDRMNDWDEASEEQASTTRTFAETRARDGVAPVCFVMQRYSEPRIVNKVCNAAHFEAVRLFYRDLPDLLDLGPEALINNCVRAFPNLYFKSEIAGEIKNFSRSYRDIRDDLHQALIALNDELPRLIEAGVPHQELGARFAAVSGFDFSPESPKTHRNKDAMKERNVSLGDKTFCCEWHLKIEPHRDRIHIHFYDPCIGNGRQILVGIFCEHLTT